MISGPQRENLQTWIGEAVTAGARQHEACAMAGITERTLQRWERRETPIDQRTTVIKVPHNTLSDAVRKCIIETVNQAEFALLAPSQIVPILAEQGTYIASESSFYRVLKTHGQLAHRHASHPPRHARPAPVTATGPNQVYSWDITYMPTTIRGLFFYLYLFIDVYSRKIVGWQVYTSESSDHAAELLKDIVAREGILPDTLTLHADNGGPMKGATMLSKMQELGVIPSFSRPAVSDDNPYVESFFRTLKYAPIYPGRFATLADARQWVNAFVDWYNHQHRHSGIRFVTPAQRHDGADIAILQKRKEVYEQAKAAHPNRWQGRATRNWEPIREVYLNPEKGKTQPVAMAVAA